MAFALANLVVGPIQISDENAVTDLNNVVPTLSTEVASGSRLTFGKTQSVELLLYNPSGRKMASTS